MQRFIVSMMRLSTAVTLFGYEQLQSSAEWMRGEQQFNKAMDRLQVAFDSLTDVLADSLGKGKRGTLSSITDMTEEVVKLSLEGMRLADPRELVKATSDMIKKSADALTGRIGQMTSTEGEEPKPAADVLS